MNIDNKKVVEGVEVFMELAKHNKRIRQEYQESGLDLSVEDKKRWWVERLIEIRKEK